MTAKEELRELYRINCSLRRLKQQKKDLESAMVTLQSPSGKLTPDKVQTSLVGDRMAQKIAKLAEVETKISETICNLEMYKHTIMQKIESISDERYRSVLYYRYVKFMKWENIAACSNYTIQHVHRLHGEALNEYSKL